MKLLSALLLFLPALTTSGQQTNHFSLGSMPLQIEVWRENGQVAVFPRGAKPFCFGLYIGPTNATESDLQLVCAFTNEAAGALSWRPPAMSLKFVTTNFAFGDRVLVQVRAWPVELGTSHEEAWQNDRAGTGSFGRTSLGMTKLTPTYAPAPSLFGGRFGLLNTLVIKPRSP